MAGGGKQIEPLGGLKTPAERLSRPLVQFVALESSSGLILIAFAVAAMIWANSPWAANYFALWKQEMIFGVGDWAIQKPVLKWINDGLMAIFFFFVGLEIKREVLAGELNTFRKAALPLFAAVGGMLFPALIYSAFNWGQPSIRGWGAPMATDIAFALGLLGLLGSRVPVALKVFLTALAIVDDIGAVAVVAIFYTEQIDTMALIWSGGLMLVLLAMSSLKVRAVTAYFAVSAVLWYFVLRSGVHATVAGIVVAMFIPAWSRIKPGELRERAQGILNTITDDCDPYDPETRHALREMTVRSREAQSPLARLEKGLAPWVAFGIMPIFALANAGVTIPSDPSVWTSPIMLGIVVALIAGNTIGITIMSWLALKLGIATMPPGVNMKSIIGCAALAGVGFTMSLFIANLAFTDAAKLDQAKLGIIIGSTLAAIIGLTLLSLGAKKAAAESA